MAQKRLNSLEIIKFLKYELERNDFVSFGNDVAGKYNKRFSIFEKVSENNFV